jgi:tRNA-uridine 2-sulfurtransferase
MSRVVLAMSGGVDSSVAAWLLGQQGHEVIGLFMRHGQEEACPSGLAAVGQRRQGCCSAADAADARRVADQLKLPFYAVDFQEDFDRIIRYFIAEYTAGRTPNPCIVCNTWLKFGRLFQYADSVGAEFVATGHYAVLARGPQGEPELRRGRDHSKDQSYVLWGIPRRLLPRLLFPLGERRKAEIRQIAGELGLRHVAHKPDSQEICFVADNDHARFIRQRVPGLDTSGEIVTTDGTVVGRHDGLEGFTVGQRKGLRIAFGHPRYVVRIDAASRQVVVGSKAELARRELTAGEANWLAGDSLLKGTGTICAATMQAWCPSSGRDRPTTLRAVPGRCPANGVSPHENRFACQVKVRYRSPPAAATVEILPGDRFRVDFNEPCYGVAPGQAVVCYQDDKVLGGGWIEN